MRSIIVNKCLNFNFKIKYTDSGKHKLKGSLIALSRVCPGVQSCKSELSFNKYVKIDLTVNLN